MSTPWETIIKVYRKQLGKNSFPTLKDYQLNFIEFLRVKNFFADEEIQKLYFKNFAFEIIKSVIEEVVSKNSDLVIAQSVENQVKLLAHIEIQFDYLIQIWVKKTDLCSEFSDYTFERFEEYSNQLIDEIIDSQFTQYGFKVEAEMLLKIKRIIFYIQKAKENVLNFTGLIFTGFGEDEIYPQLIPLNISIVADNRLRYYVDEKRVASISNNMNGAVRPFAQTDVIDTILQGIDPNLDDIYSQNFGKTFQKYNETIVEVLRESNPELSKKISELDTSVVIDELQKMNNQIKLENYINPLMNAVSSLSKEDLAEMAESLIYLTYLKRRITFAEESVGGPVDVAIISKGDGFVWIKRKHYFRPELNQHFIRNYFKK